MRDSSTQLTLVGAQLEAGRSQTGGWQAVVTRSMRGDRFGSQTFLMEPLE
jgi:hypothetical protein